MGQSCTLTGMVLTSMPVGEYDRRITILTKERGKIAAFVKGARRPKSTMVAATNPFCFGEFEAYAGRNSYTVVRASIQNYFQEISKDLEKTYYGCYFLEVADYFSMENSDCQEQLKLLYQTLRALSVKSLSPRLVRRIYELKTLVYHGVYPNVFSCVECGSKEDLVWYDRTRRVMFCKACARGRSMMELSPAVLYTLQYIITSPITKLYTFTVKDDVLSILDKIIAECMGFAADRSFRSAAFLPEG